MVFKFGVTALVGAAALASTPAHAQEVDAAAAALGQCLTDKSTGSDRVILARWFVTALAAVPQLEGVADVKPATREAIDRAIAGVFTRLLTVDCLEPSRQVAKTSGNAGFTIAGQTFGRIAMREILNDPKADTAMSGFSAYLKDEDFATLAPTM